MLRRQAVFDRHDATARFRSQPARSMIMASDAANRPAAAMSEKLRAQFDFLRLAHPYLTRRVGVGKYPIF